MLETIERHRDRVIERAILPRTRWKPGELARRGPARRTLSSQPSRLRAGKTRLGRPLWATATIAAHARG